jgi:hypothetical protein
MRNSDITVNREAMTHRKGRGRALVPKHSRLFGNVYKVRDQSGFYQALFQAMSGGGGYNKRDLKEAVTNQPKKYPCVVSFIDYMFENRAIKVDWKHIRDYDSLNL